MDLRQEVLEDGNGSELGKLVDVLRTERELPDGAGDGEQDVGEARVAEAGDEGLEAAVFAHKVARLRVLRALNKEKEQEMKGIACRNRSNNEVYFRF